MSAEVYAIPFEEQFIIYRPLRRLAFIGNAALARYAAGRAAGRIPPAGGDVDDFLSAIRFCDPDPPGPAGWAPGAPHQPTLAVLLMTGACNLRCTYCYARGGEEARLRMTTPVARRVMGAAHANARRLGRKSWSLTFHGPGEPTTNWRVLVDAVAHARRKELPCHISMSTNGVLSDEKLRFVVRRFDSAAVSFDGIREVQDAQRPRPNGAGSFDAAAGTMRAFDAAGFSYSVRLTSTPPTFGRLAESVGWLCENTRCRSLQVEPAYGSERGCYADPTPELAEAFARAFMDAFKVAAAAGRSLTYSGARPWLLTGAFCRAPQEALIATPEGDLVTCYETTDRRHPLIRPFTVGKAGARGVRVDPEALDAFARKQEERRAQCRGCFCYWHCGGDCATKCWSLSPQRGRCLVNRAITRELLAWYIAAGDGVWRGEGGPRVPSLAGVARSAEE